MIKDLIAARLAANEPILFEAEDVSVHDLESASPEIQFRANGTQEKLQCDFIAGCDGFHGICRPSIPTVALQLYDRDYPFGWLGILAQAPPSSHELIYAYHQRGFALLSMRSPEISRLYLQCAPDEDIANWPDDRIWQELQQAFGNRRRMEADRRTGHSKRRDRDAKFCHRANAIRETISGRRRGAHRAADRRERTRILPSPMFAFWLAR